MQRMVFLACMGLMILGCEKKTMDQLFDPTAGGAVPQTSGTYVIFDDELKTAGGLGFIPGGENQSISFTDQSSPRRSIHQIAYSWNGLDISSGPLPTNIEHAFSGFSLTVSNDLVGISGATGKNLSAAGYTKLHFFIRGYLSYNNTVRIEGPSNGADNATPARLEFSTLGSDWQEVVLPVPAADFSNVKIFLTISLQYAQPPRTTAPGGGGVVYLDDIHYER